MRGFDDPVLRRPSHHVACWTPGDEFPAGRRERIVWKPAGAGEPFVLGLEELFWAI